MTPEVTMSQSSTVVLASGAINCAGDVVELHRPADNPAFVLRRWPPSPMVCNSHPQALASMASALVQLLATAQATLAKIRAERDL
jgi:hypothetical protein